MYTIEKTKDFLWYVPIFLPRGGDLFLIHREGVHPPPSLPLPVCGRDIYFGVHLTLLFREKLYLLGLDAIVDHASAVLPLQRLVRNESAKNKSSFWKATLHNKAISQKNKYLMTNGPGKLAAKDAKN